MCTYTRLHVRIKTFKCNDGLKCDKNPFDVGTSLPLKSRACGFVDPCIKKVYLTLGHFHNIHSLLSIVMLLVVVWDVY